MSIAIKPDQVDFASGTPVVSYATKDMLPVSPPDSSELSVYPRDVADVARRPHKKGDPIHIVALGASNTCGKGVLPSESYPAQLQTLLREKGADVVVHNAGINGDTTGGMLKRLNTVPEGTQLVILQPGGNDFRQGLGMERGRNIAEIVNQLKTRGIKVIIMENDMLLSRAEHQKQADTIHLTPKGYALLAEQVLPQVEMALGRYQLLAA